MNGSKPPLDVLVVVVNWNGADDTIACLNSLAAAGGGTAFEVLVVENGSVDGSSERIRSAIPNAKILKTGRNLGFTGGYNAGAKEAIRRQATYILFLNNDTIVAPSFFAPLLDVLRRDSSIGVVSPVIHYVDETGNGMDPYATWFSGSAICLARGYAVQENARLPAIDEPPVELPWVTGCAMLMRRDVVERIAGFDSEFFILWEDLDLCLRLHRLGLRCMMVPASRIAHRVSRSLAKSGTVTNYYYVRNMLRVIARHEPGWRGRTTGTSWFLVRVVREHLRRARRGIGGGIGVWAMIARGVVHAAVRKMGQL